MNQKLVEVLLVVLPQHEVKLGERVLLENGSGNHFVGHPCTHQRLDFVQLLRVLGVRVLGVLLAVHGHLLADHALQVGLVGAVQRAAGLARALLTHN